ncbi:MAG: hypothetical protein JNM76_02590 [Betaproteobacteria bacterium]|nr:hypothetical protein [Betaproteobacteria bacterium]
MLFRLFAVTLSAIFCISNLAYAQLTPPKPASPMLVLPPAPPAGLQSIDLSAASAPVGQVSLSMKLQSTAQSPSVCTFQVTVAPEGSGAPLLTQAGVAASMPGSLGPFSIKFEKAGKHRITVAAANGPKDKCQGTAQAAFDVLAPIAPPTAPSNIASPPTSSQAPPSGALQSPPSPKPPVFTPPPVVQAPPPSSLTPPPGSLQPSKPATPPAALAQANVPKPTLINKIVSTKLVYEIGDTLKFSAWADKPGTCGKLYYAFTEVGGTEYAFSEPKSLPLEFEITAGKPGYPTAPGEYKMRVGSQGIDCAGQGVATFTMKLKATSGAKLTDFRPEKPAFEYGEAIVLDVVREKPGTCSLNLVSEGKMVNRPNVALPGKVTLPFDSPLYPKSGGELKVLAQGVLPECEGGISTTAKVKPKPSGKFSGAKVENGKYSTIEYYAGIPLNLTLSGQGNCHVKVVLTEQGTGKKWYEREVTGSLPQQWKSDFNLPPYGKSHEVPKIVLDVSVEPVAGAAAKADCTGSAWKSSMLMYCGEAGYAKLKECKPFGEQPPEASQPESKSAPSKPADPPKGPIIAGGSLKGVSAPKASGAITNMIVPGGSFAVDDPQKIQVNGSGACGFDLRIWNTNYGGTHDKTVAIAPMNLANGALLYNGTHFATLAEGSYSASATGKVGCAEVAQIDFKVTAPKLIKKVPGKPTLSVDAPPKSGGTYSKSKDGVINFKVALPKLVREEPNASCCDIEYNFKNQYGAWEVLQPAPISDSSFGLAMKQSSAVVGKSVSGFTQGTQWRMKVRASKFQVDFDWSDWLEFKTTQQ